MPSVAYVWSPQLEAAANELPANKGRSSRVHGLIRALGLVRLPGSTFEEAREWEPARIVPPNPKLSTEAELRRYHDPRYVDYLLNNGDVDADTDPDSDSSSSSTASDASARRRKRRRVAAGLEYDCPPFSCLGAYARLVAGATLTACAQVAERKAHIVVVWDGGRHHAQRARASGFCYVADAVLGILALSRAPPVTAPWGSWEALADETEEEKGVEGGDEDPDEDEGKEQEDEESTLPPPPPPPPKPRRSRVLYLDMDLHYGDGVALAFRSPAVFPYPLKGRPRPPQVLTLSVHHAAPIFFPPGAPSTTPADTPHLFSLAYGLEAYAHAPTYARAWASIERIAAAWKPDYVVLQLGVDALPRDPVGMYGGWGVVGPGSVPWVVERVRAWARPTVVLGGGGYVSADAARAWALSTARLVGSPVGPEESVPDHGFWEEYAPGYTLEVPESHALDENTGETLDAAEEAFTVLADRIREIVALHA